MDRVWVYTYKLKIHVCYSSSNICIQHRTDGDGQRHATSPMLYAPVPNRTGHNKNFTTDFSLIEDEDEDGYIYVI